jgi:hypothetical protein
MFSSSLQNGPIKANGREGHTRSLTERRFWIEAEESVKRLCGNDFVVTERNVLSFANVTTFRDAFSLDSFLQ